jgi:hypothetical protein
VKKLLEAVAVIPSRKRLVRERNRTKTGDAVLRNVSAEWMNVPVPASVHSVLFWVETRPAVAGAFQGLRSVLGLSKINTG